MGSDLPVTLGTTSPNGLVITPPTLLMQIQPQKHRSLSSSMLSLIKVVGGISAHVAQFNFTEINRVRRESGRQLITMKGEYSSVSRYRGDRGTQSSVGCQLAGFNLQFLQGYLTPNY